MRYLCPFLPFLHSWAWVSFYGNLWQIEACVRCGHHRIVEAA